MFYSKKNKKTLKYIVHSSGKNVQKDLKIVRSILVLDFVVTLTGFWNLIMLFVFIVVT